MAKSRHLGDCRLCGTHGPLEHSHIVSRAAYRRALGVLPGEPVQRQLMRVASGVAELTSKQVKEYLLCRACEERFGRWETLSFPMLSQLNSSLPWLEAVSPVAGPVHDSQGVNVRSLALFGLSLFWRASVSKEFATYLGAYEGPLGKYLLGEANFPNEAVLVVTLLDHRGRTAARIDRGFMLYEGSRQDGYDCHRLTILGVDMRLFCGARVPSAFYELCFVQTGRVVVKPSDEFVEELAPSLALS